MNSGVVQMLVASLFFTSMNVMVKFLPHIPPYEIVFFRCVISFVLSIGHLTAIGVPIFGNNKKLLLTRGILGICALTMFFTTLQNIPLASAVSIQYLSPILTAIFGIWILKEQVKRFQWFFFAIAFGGVLLIKGFDPRISLFYFIIGICAATVSALAYNCVRKLRHSDHPLVVVLYFPLVGIPVTGLISAFNWVVPTSTDLLLLLGIGVATQVAQVNMTKAFQNERIAQMSGIRYTGILYALLFGYFFFGETYHWVAFLGMLLVISGVLFNIFFKVRFKESE